MSPPACRNCAWRRNQPSMCRGRTLTEVTRVAGFRLKPRVFLQKNPASDRRRSLLEVYRRQLERIVRSEEWTECKRTASDLLRKLADVWHRAFQNELLGQLMRGWIAPLSIVRSEPRFPGSEPSFPPVVHLPGGSSRVLPTCRLRMRVVDVIDDALRSIWAILWIFRHPDR